MFAFIQVILEIRSENQLLPITLSAYLFICVTVTSIASRIAYTISFKKICFAFIGYVTIIYRRTTSYSLISKRGITYNPSSV